MRKNIKKAVLLFLLLNLINCSSSGGGGSSGSSGSPSTSPGGGNVSAVKIDNNIIYIYKGKRTKSILNRQTFPLFLHKKAP